MNIGVTLMIVGMVTVFAVLLIIINLSKLLIKLVNKFALEENVKKDVKQNGPEIPANIMAVIQQTVKEITNGKGTVSNVVKI
ncbi:MAG: OadG family protein [Prevotella sp.]|mgnify:FL=1|nr:OadG family protein [Prevotella sp.]MDY4161542.1 OadG family protein [Prevotella sp.]